jgi:hypothetical protein
LSRVGIGVGIGRAPALGAADDLAQHRQQRLGLLVKEVADGGVALGHPGAVVEQARGVEEEAQVDGHAFAAEFGNAHDRFVIQARGIGVAEEFQIFFFRDADLEARRTANTVNTAEVESVPLGPARVWIACVEGGGGMHHGFGIFGIERKDGHRVERAAGRHHAAGRKPAQGRLVADEVVEGRRHAARAGGVGAQRKAAVAQRHGNGRAGAGTA